MRLILIIYFLCFVDALYAQAERNSLIDSLESVLHDIRNMEKEQGKIDDESRKVDILCLLSREYDGIDSTKTFDLAYEALEISERQDYAKGFADANFSIGRALMYIDAKKAITYLEKGNTIVRQLIKKDSSQAILKLWANGTYNLGLSHGYLGRPNKELEITEKVIPVVESLKDTSFLANIYTNLGVKHLTLGNPKEAYPNLINGRKLYKRLGNPQQATFNLIQLAMAYDGMDSLMAMKNILSDAKKVLEKYPNAFDIFNYGVQESQYYIRTQQPKKALETLDKIFYLVENAGNSVQYGMMMQRYAKVYETMNDFEKSIAYTSKYIENAKALGSGSSWFQGLYKKSQYEASSNNFKGAYKDLLKAVDVYDSLETINTVAKLEEMGLKFETAEQEKEILELRVKNEEKKSQAYLLGGLASILGLLLFTGYYAYNQKMRKARKKARMQKAEVEIMKQEQQNQIFSAMIEGQEKERKRLAIDLHDGLGGRLSGISMNLSKLDKDEPKQYPKEQLQKVMKDLNDSLTELRSIARNMMPETLVKFGLQAALKDYCSSMTGGETKVTLQFYGSDNGIDINQQVTMYRVIQELINNAIKHARASEVLVQFMREGSQIDITVEDNGVGFNKNKDLKKNNTGMGLSNLQTRVAYLKGNIDFETEENEGTTVNVHINIDAA